MSANFILQHSAIRSKKKLNTAGEIRHRLRFLQKTFGRLEDWPAYAKIEYHELARKLHQLENGRS